jgi:aerobic-type carbon monoxide dehydrogenase small subunit (CoxS/CutS family)
MILNVNACDYDIDPGARTLLEVLRDDLGLMGTKEGCGIGLCGACTVLVDGKPYSSCLMLAVQAGGRDILTIEGLTQNKSDAAGGVVNSLHPVQRAFVEQGAFQCAYCTPGFVLSSLALLAENPQPNEMEIREYLSGNLCRCGSYENIIRAVIAASKSAEK